LLALPQEHLKDDKRYRANDLWRIEGRRRDKKSEYSSFKERPADPRKSNQTLRRWPAANTATRQ
jgi:hypothetical protein